MVSSEIRLIIFFAAKDGRLYTVSKNKTGSCYGSDHELIIAKFRLILKKVGKNHWTIQVWPKSNPLRLYSGSEK